MKKQVLSFERRKFVTGKKMFGLQQKKKKKKKYYNKSLHLVHLLN